MTISGDFLRKRKKSALEGDKCRFIGIFSGRTGRAGPGREGPKPQKKEVKISG